MIVKEIKTTYKVKKITYKDGVFVDEDNTIVDLTSELAAIFADEVKFDLTAIASTKEMGELSDFVEEEIPPIVDPEPAE